MGDIMADYIQQRLSNVSAQVRDPKKIQRAVGFQNLRYNLNCRKKIKWPSITLKTCLCGLLNSQTLTGDKIV